MKMIFNIGQCGLLVFLLLAASIVGAQDAGLGDAAIDVENAYPSGMDGGTAPVPLAPGSPVAAAPPVSQQASGPEVVEVEVRARSRADTLRRSALAVSVVDVAEARRGSADLGEVLARVEGVAVRRTGGLGSEQRFSLAGFQDEQIRFFLDGLPLESSGYPFGVANVPLSAIERVEIYRGVVPIRFGADALGGALNLVSKLPQQGLHGSASYQAGSFDTHRAALASSYGKDDYFFKAEGFADYAANDYPVTVPVADADGTPSTARVRRFNDEYRAKGVSVVAGVTNKPWAERASLRVFLTDYERQLQSDPAMVTAYGDARTLGRSSGASGSYRQVFADKLELELAGNYAHSLTRFQDTSSCRYDWFGRCDPSQKPGEIRDAADQNLTQHALALRANASYELTPGHKLSVALAPNHVRRGGEDRFPGRPDRRDPLDADRRLTTLVLGLDYSAALFGERLVTNVFGKTYLQYKRSEELLRDSSSVRRDADIERLGAGASARYALTSFLWLKASYEYATRLPSVNETFGNGVLIDPNLLLKPELSHNVNLSLTLDHTHPRAGRFQAEGLTFVRDAEQLIFLSGNAIAQMYVNAASARSLGGQGSASWTSRGDYLRADLNGTYQAFRNTSSEGPFARFEGDRMPYLPYLFANAALRAQLPQVFADKDRLSLSWTLRYTHRFFRAWESAGRRDTKDVIPSQSVHGLVLTYLVQKSRAASYSMSIEAHNLTNERVFDFFGVEKPGRSVFAKCVAEL